MLPPRPRPRPRPRLLCIGAALLLVACPKPGSDDDGGETETETGEEAHFLLRTVSGGSFDVQGMSFVECTGDPSGYTRIEVQFDGAGSVMIQSDHTEPDCSDLALDAAQFDITGGPSGDLTIVGWEPGSQPAHITVPLVGTRVDALRVGEDGQQIPTKSVLLVDDSLAPPRIYSGREDGPLDAEGFPTTMWSDFMYDAGAPLQGAWIATTSKQIHNLDGSGPWVRCTLDPDSNSYVYETWSFSNDRLDLQRYDNGDDPSCALGDQGTGGGALPTAVLVYRDVEDSSWPGGPPPEASVDGPVTTTMVELWDNEQIGSRLMVLDDGASPARLYVSADADGYRPETLEPVGLTLP